MFILIRAIWREIVSFTPNFALFTNMWFKHDLDSKIEHLYNAYAEAYFDLLYIFTLYIYLYMFCKRYSTNRWRTVILLLCHLITPNHMGVTIFFVDVFCSKIINKIKQVRFDPKYMNQRQTLSCCTVCWGSYGSWNETIYTVHEMIPKCPNPYDCSIAVERKCHSQF